MHHSVKFITNAGQEITIDRQTEADARVIFNVCAESPNVQRVARFAPPPPPQAVELAIK